MYVLIRVQYTESGSRVSGYKLGITIISVGSQFIKEIKVSYVIYAQGPGVYLSRTDMIFRLPCDDYMPVYDVFVLNSWPFRRPHFSITEVGIVIFAIISKSVGVVTHENVGVTV